MKKLIAASAFLLIACTMLGQFTQVITARRRASSAFQSLTVDSLTAMNMSTPGTTLTTAILNAGTESPVTPYFWDTAPTSTAGAWTVGSNISSCSNLGPVAVTGGTTHGTGTLGFHNISLANSGASLNYWNNGTEVSVTNFSALMCIHINIALPDTTTAWDFFRIDSVDGQSAIINYNSETNAPRVILEVNNNITSVNTVSLTVPGTYWFSLNLNMVTGLGTLYVYDTTGAQVGLVMTATNTGVIGGDTINVSRLGNSEAGTAASGAIQFQNLMTNWSTAPNPFFWSH